MSTGSARCIFSRGGRVSASLLLGIAVLLQPSIAAVQKTPARGLWVWETSPLLHNPQERTTFFDFCQRHAIDVAGVYIGTEAAAVGKRLASAAEWAVLLAEGRRRGMRLHALDGDPAYALPSQHDTVLWMP